MHLGRAPCEDEDGDQGAASPQQGMPMIAGKCPEAKQGGVTQSP